MSAMITRAPACAIMMAISRPTPPPAPVTIATFPSIKPVIPALPHWHATTTMTRPGEAVELLETPHALTLSPEDAVFGLNQDFPLLLSSVLEHGAANFPDVQVVSVNRDEHVRLNYRAVAARARRLASALRRLGLGPDTLAGSLAWNSHRHLELFYGVTGLGAVLHTANPRLPPAQICYTINFTGYRTLFIDLDTVALVESLAPRLDTVRQFVVMAPRDAM